DLPCTTFLILRCERSEPRRTHCFSPANSLATPLCRKALHGAAGSPYGVAPPDEDHRYTTFRARCSLHYVPCTTFLILRCERSEPRRTHGLLPATLRDTPLCRKALHGAAGSP